MVEDFKTFILRGNILDLAVGIVIGGAFAKIVTSFVNDLLMPPIGQLTGGIDFQNLFINLSGKHYVTLAAAQAAGASTLNYGVFLNTVVQFLIIGLAVFLLIRQVNRFTTPKTTAVPTTQPCPFYLSKIAIQALRCSHCTSHLSSATSV